MILELSRLSSDRLVLVVAAVQRWWAVAGVRPGTAGLAGVARTAARVTAAGVAIVVRSGAGAAQRGLVRPLGIEQPALVLNAREASLDVVELRSGDGVLILGRQDARNLFLRMENAVRSLRMIAESLGDQAGLALLESLHLLKEADEGLRIVTGAVHVLHAKVVRLRLKLAGKLEEGNGNGELSGLIDSVAGPGIAGQHDERHHADLHVVEPRHFARRVMRADVGRLVCHYACKLRL